MNKFILFCIRFALSLPQKEIWEEKKNISYKTSNSWKHCARKELPCGILYRVLENGKGEATPRYNSVVSVHYKGSLINGREFDNSWKRKHPEAFRLNQVIKGWQIALQQMHIGDHWLIYIPFAIGYGTRSNGPIPAFSTLIFEVKLLGIA